MDPAVLLNFQLWNSHPPNIFFAQPRSVGAVLSFIPIRDIDQQTLFPAVPCANTRR
jgi:hypothetical protein